MTPALQAAVDEQSAWQFIGAVTHIIDQLDPADATATDLGNAIGRIQRARERHLPSWAQRHGGLAQLMVAAAAGPPQPRRGMDS